MTRQEAMHGVLLGTAVGDSLGLPMEGLSRRRQPRLFPGPLRQRFAFGRGMVSDDTEHTVMVAQALLAHPADAAAFQQALAWKLRWWLLALPAGVGFATLRSVGKLWLGVPPSRSGVFSAGNGPAMRSAILGAFFAEDAARRQAYVRASTRLTHTDPRAEIAAQAVAEAAAVGLADGAALLEHLAALSAEAEWQATLAKLTAALAQQHTVAEFAAALGLARGVTGYAFHTVPVALYAALRHAGDFAAGLSAAIGCGGDTDTVGAITGALLGSQVGVAGMPRAWHEEIVDWPCSTRLLGRLAERLAAEQRRPIRLCWPAVPLRNGVFLGVVLAHGLRRLLPPF